MWQWTLHDSAGLEHFQMTWIFQALTLEWINQFQNVYIEELQVLSLNGILICQYPLAHIRTLTFFYCFENVSIDCSECTAVLELDLFKMVLAYTYYCWRIFYLSKYYSLQKMQGNAIADFSFLRNLFQKPFCIASIVESEESRVK